MDPIITLINRKKNVIVNTNGSLQTSAKTRLYGFRVTDQEPKLRKRVSFQNLFIIAAADACNMPCGGRLICSPVKLWGNLKQIATKGFFAVMISLDLLF